MTTKSPPPPGHCSTVGASARLMLEIVLPCVGNAAVFSWSPLPTANSLSPFTRESVAVSTILFVDRYSLRVSPFPRHSPSEILPDPGARGIVGSKAGSKPLGYVAHRLNGLRIDR